MAEQTITIGGREYEVACRDGEEAFLHLAAGLLDAEAQKLQDQIGRQPEARTLLMAGLMLADTTAGLRERLDAAEARIAVLSNGDEIGSVPNDFAERLRTLAERSEALADRVEGTDTVE